jgi:hypothetical protein
MKTDGHSGAATSRAASGNLLIVLKNRLRQKFESPIKPLGVLHGQLWNQLAYPANLVRYLLIDRGRM